MATTDPLARTLLIIVAIVLIVPFLMMLFAMPMMGMVGWGHMGDWNGTGGMWWSWLLMWAFFLLIVLGGGYLLVRTIRSQDGYRTDEAIEELRLAYARGDLSEEEFEQRRERLRRDE